MKAIILGLVQGITEFLPVSSSGHLVVMKTLLGFHSPGITFEVLLHLATMLSVLVYFNRIVIDVLLDLKYLLFIVIGSIPAAIVGVFFGDYIEQMFNGVGWVDLFFVLNGVLLVGGWWLASRKSTNRELSYGLAFLIGLAQALAVLPGISRSGMTITAGVLLGLRREEAFKFSFFLFLPAVFGAGLLKLKDITEFSSNWGEIGGFVVAFFVGIAALSILKNTLSRNRFSIYGAYTAALGIMLIVVDKIFGMV